MATDPTNSTTVNIRNLPTSQLAVDTDYFILQTNNGTQIISFKDLNAVKADIYGNATVVGNLSGGSALFSKGIITPSVSAYQFVTTNGATGFTQPLPGTVFYDSFTITNGLVTSAIPTSVNFIQNPMYTSLFTQLTAASASIVNRTGGRIYDYTQDDNSVVIAAGATVSNLINWPGAAPSLTVLPVGAVKPSSFIISPDGDASTPTLSSVPYVKTSDITFAPSTNTLSYKISISQPANTITYFNARLLVVY